MTDPLAHRKATVKLRLLRKDGTPAAGKTAAFDQTGHRFLFGCGASEAEAMARAKTSREREESEKLLRLWLGLFNYGTLHFYWGRFEPEEGHTLRETQTEAARILREKGVTLKGHPLCWHTVCAPWLMKFGDEEILRRQLARIRREMTDFRGLIGLWDVINEAVIMPHFDKYDNAVTRICRTFGTVPLTKALFDTARETDPGAVLLINDFNTGPAYEELIERLMDSGVPIGAVGIQSHQHQGYWGREKLENVLERFSRFGLPLHFTENTLISGELMPPHIVDLNDFQVQDWPTTPEGEDRQARQVAEMAGILFGHPLVEAFTSWDFTDRCWLNAPAGFVRKDGTPKPSYDALKELIHGAWETHGRTGTDENGCLTVTGFKGDYLLTADGETAAFSLDRDGEMTLVLGQ